MRKYRFRINGRQSCIRRVKTYQVVFTNTAKIVPFACVWDAWSIFFSMQRKEAGKPSVTRAIFIVGYVTVTAVNIILKWSCYFLSLYCKYFLRAIASYWFICWCIVPTYASESLIDIFFWGNCVWGGSERELKSTFKIFVGYTWLYKKGKKGKILVSNFLFSFSISIDVKRG